MKSNQSQLFIANINYEASEEALETFFRDAGFPVSLRICIDKTGRPSGYAFAEIDRDLAADAVEHMKNAKFLGRRLHVAHAVEKAERHDHRPPKQPRYLEGGRRCKA